LGQIMYNEPYAIYYASRTLDKAQVNYATMKKELLAVLFALEKFHSYLINSKVIVFTNHTPLKDLSKKSDSKPYLFRWVLLLQEFDLKIHDKDALENAMASHLSQLGSNPIRIEELPIDDSFPDD